jgi:hypothetical protein
VPANDFAPGNAAAVDGSKVYLIKGSTLKKLLVQVSCDPSQFDVKVTPDTRVYTYRAPGASSGVSSSPGWWGTIAWKFFVDITDTEPYTALYHTYENGILVGVSTEAPGDDPEEVTGTGNDPGTATLSTFATP